jgi:phospholipid transport system substrate-binding protein
MGQAYAYASTDSALDIVRTTSDKVIKVLSTEKKQLEEHPERLYGLINKLVLPHFDFALMSRWVLGKEWNSTPVEKQEQFIEQFKTLLVRTYAKALLEYSGQDIVYLTPDSKPNSKLVIIKTEVAGNGSSHNIPINYRMHSSGGEWKVIDIAIDGISLVGTYRGEFGAEIRKNGVDSLIHKLTERNADRSGPESQVK